MKSGSCWSLWIFAARDGSPWGGSYVLGVVLLALMLPGCVAHSPLLEKGLVARRHERIAGVVENYQVGCPDVLHIHIDEGPKLDGDYTVSPEGRITLGTDKVLRVDGKTPPEVAHQVADETGCQPEQVQVEVTGYHSQYLILFGQVIGWQRVVPYRGQETVLDVLQRTGGVTRGAAPNDVYVVRTHMEDGRRPEVFRVDLAAIVM